VCGKKAPRANLIDCARFLAGERQGPDQVVLDDLAAWGADAPITERVNEQAEAAQCFDVLPENWDAARLFVAVGTQWRYAGMAGLPTGLDYAGVAVVMERLGFDGETFGQLQIMEGAALAYWREDLPD